MEIWKYLSLLKVTFLFLFLVVLIKNRWDEVTVGQIEMSRGREENYQHLRLPDTALFRD